MTLHLSDLRPGMVLTWQYEGSRHFTAESDYLTWGPASYMICDCECLHYANDLVDDDGALPGFRLKTAE